MYISLQIILGITIKREKNCFAFPATKTNSYNELVLETETTEFGIVS